MAKRRQGTVTPYGSSLPSSPAKPVVSSTAGVAPQNPYVSNSPGIDPNLEASKVAAGRNVAFADADAGYQNARIENEYGLGSDISNPFSQAKLYEESYKRGQRGTQNSYAAQGQLNSGAYGRAQGENDRNYLMGYDKISRGYSDALANVTRNQLQTYNSNAMGVDQSQYDAILRALRAIGGN